MKGPCGPFYVADTRRLCAPGAKPDWSELKKRTDLPLWEVRRDMAETRPRCARDAPETVLSVSLPEEITRDAPEIRRDSSLPGLVRLRDVHGRD